VAQISAQDLDTLQAAKTTLENPGLTAQLTDLIGKPIERGMQLLPEKARSAIHAATEAALTKVVNVAVLSMDTHYEGESRDWLHRSMAVVSGAAGGAFGLPGLVVELPLTTTIMMRSILDIARSLGEDISDTETRLNALIVFALGGRAPGDDSAESGYLAVRAALARSISEASQYLASRGAAGAMAQANAPALLRLITKVASRFSIPVTQKTAVQAVPIVGAAGGAIINALFINHFQDMGRGHFTVRRLEKKYSPALIETCYLRLRD
jgi:hypothetical protein